MWLSLVGYLGGYPYVHVVVSFPYYVVPHMVFVFYTSLGHQQDILNLLLGLGNPP
jgi:hypothetical protein